MSSQRDTPSSRESRDDRAWFEQAFDENYPGVYSHRDLGEARALVGLLDRQGLLTHRPALDLGCGSGRHLVALAEVGVPVVGLDLSWTLLVQAKTDLEEGDHPSRLIRGDWRRLPFASAGFGLVLSLFTSFGYFEDSLDEERQLRETARVLRAGSPFLLDYLNARSVREGLPRTSTRRIGDRELSEVRTISDNGRKVLKEITVRSPGEKEVKYCERVTLYSLPELTDMLALTGFRVEARWGTYEGAPFREEDSPRLILLCRRG